MNVEVELEFISSEVLKGKTLKDKIDFILDKVRKDKIIVLEENLSPFEESILIEQTMRKVSKKFPGIEVSTLHEKKEGVGLREWLIRLLGGTTGGLTVIGPSRLITKVKKEPQTIKLLAGEKGK